MNIKRLLPALICVGIPILAAAGTPSPRTINAVFTVNSVADSVDVNPGNGVCQDASGQCSLRAAIMEANALTGPDTIVFDPITDGQPQLLQLHGAGENAAATGDLDITEGLTITGNGIGKTIIDGDAADRVFDILSATGTVEIDDLTIQNGNAVTKGGGLEAFYSTLILKNDLIQNNTAQNLSGVAEGGGIYGQNSLVTLDNTTVKGNTSSASSAAYGGGIASDNNTPATGVLSILDGSVVTGNVAQGGSYYALGGGVAILDDSALTMDASAVRGNKAIDTDAGASADGGGIKDTLNTSNGAYSITNSEISGNTAHGDASAFGGGMNTDYVAVNSSLVNTTITGNSAISDSGNAYGGGVGLDTTLAGVTELLGNVTISGNSVQGVASQGGGISAYNNSGTIAVRNSIVAGNQDANATAPDCVGASGGTLTSGGYNLIGDDTGCSFANATGDQVGTGSAPIEPLLGALADNGGKTQTMALLAGSPAVDAGNPAGCTDGSGSPLTTDQRGDPRPTDGNGNGTAICDIGAYERAAETAPTASNGSITVTAGSSANGTLKGSAANGNPLTFSLASQPSHGTVTITNAATGAFTYKAASGYSGSDTFTFSDNDGYLDSNTATETVTVKSAPSSGGGGGGGGFGAFALFGLLLVALVPWWLRRHRPIAAGTAATTKGDLPMKRIFRVQFLAAACTSLIAGSVLAAMPAYGAPGDVDTTFNGGVPAVIDPGTGHIYDVLAGAINPANGDIVWSGNYDVSSGAIAAYKPDGTPDTAFGGIGEVILTAGAVGFSGGTMQLNGIAVDGQGRILLTGVAYDSSGGGMLIMRLNPDGSFDTSFGAAGTGYVISSLGQSEGNGLSLTADGHILVTGDAYDSGSSQYALTVWRFSADGIVDSSFGSGGYVQITAVKDGLYLGCKPGLLPDDTLLVGCELGGASEWVVVHLMTDGSMDTGFGSSGLVTSTASMDLYGLALAPDNGFVIGEADYNSPPPTDLRRFLADGSVNTAFNSGNPFDLSTLMGTATRLPVGAQADGKPLVSGNDGTTTLNVVRLLTDGTLDGGFGTNGVGTVDFSNIGGSGYASEPSAVLIQGDGKIVVLGYAVNNTDSRRISFVTRLDNDSFSFTPASFSFMAQTGVARSTLVTSNAITVSGLSNGVSVPVSVNGGEYQINSGAWTRTPGFTQNGDQIAVRHTSSSSYSTQTTTTLTIGGEAIPNNNSTVLGSNTSATFTSTTKAQSSGGGGSGGGGGFGWLALLGLFILALVPQWLRRRREHTRGDVARHLFAPAVTGCVLALTLTGLVSAAPAFAAPGDVDTTFNGGIPAILDLNPSGEVRAYGAAINPLNGDILWSGYALTTVVSGGAITAYKPGGTLDTGVAGGSGEIVLTADQAGAPGGQVDLYAIAVDGQGRILASGVVSNSSGYAMVLARFKPDGTLDTGFGAGGTGVVTDALNTTAIGTGLSLTSDGHILVTGSAANAAITEAELTVWRFNPDGTADTGFGDNGHIQLPGIAGTGLELCLAALQPDGGLIAGFPSTSGGSWKIARLNPDGSVDTAFGASGFITGSTGLSLAGLALAPDGGFVISELDQSSSPPPIDLRRYLADGTVDSGFNGGNPLSFGTLPGPSAFLPVTVQPDGKIVASGSGGSNNLVVARLLVDGTFDTTFGNVSGGGGSVIDFNNINGINYAPGATALLLQGNGRIVASGYANSSAGSSYAAFVTRLDNGTFTLVPAAFSFMNQGNVSRSTLVTSNAITVSGLSSGVSVPVSVSGGEYRINSGAWTRGPGFVQDGDQVAVRQTSSSSYSTQITTTLTVGGEAIPNNDSTVLGTPVSASFSSTTKSAPTSGGSGSGSGGGGGSLGGFALLALLVFALVPWGLRHKHRRFSK